MILRVRNPDTFAALRPLLWRAIDTVEYPGVQPDELCDEWAVGIAADHFGMFVGFEGGQAQAVAVVVLPTSFAMMGPQCLLAYNEGSPGLARRIGAKVKTWLIEHGYNSLLGLNRRYDDDCFIRGFRHFGHGKPIGTMMEFSL